MMSTEKNNLLEADRAQTRPACRTMQDPATSNRPLQLQGPNNNNTKTLGSVVINQSKCDQRKEPMAEFGEECKNLSDAMETDASLAFERNIIKTLTLL